MLIRTTIAALAALALTAGAAQAQQNRSSRTVVTTDDGRQFTREVTRSGGFGDRRGTVTWTGPNGRTTTREFRRTWDRENGFRRRSVRTGPRGRTATVDAGIRCSGGACERRAVRRGFQGRSRLIEGSARRVAPGVIEGRRAVTGPRGRTRELRWRRLRR